MMRSESEVKELLEKMKKDYIKSKGAMPKELLTGFNIRSKKSPSSVSGRR